MGGTSPAKKELVPGLQKVKEAVVHRVSAEDMAKKQREISVSEFFAKNRHLLGFDSPRKALLTAVKEAVDNSLDACEEAGILPDLVVEVKEISEGRFRVAVEDNGPRTGARGIERVQQKTQLAIAPDQLFRRCVPLGLCPRSTRAH